jgi:pimeloyl-ACP methyl ester carboxylesterase
MLYRILLSIGVLLLLAVLIVTASYHVWRSAHYDALLSGGEFSETSAGTIQYSLQGSSGPTLLFLHGTPGGFDQGLGEQPDLTVLTPSRPGYLGTPLSVGESPAEQARSYIALMDKLNIESVIVIGASGGGPSAISFAAMFPERTRALIAIEAVAKSEELQKLPAFLSSDFLVWLMFSFINLLPDETVIQMMIPDPANQQLALDDPSKVAVIRSLSWSLWPPSLRGPGMDNDIMQFSNLSLPIDKISVPTLVIHGTADTNVDFSHGELLANTIPKAQFLVIKGGDHMMPFTHEEETQEAIFNFLERVIGETQ